MNLQNIKDQHVKRPTKRPTTSKFCLCWTTVVGDNSSSIICVYARCFVQCYRAHYASTVLFCGADKAAFYTQYIYVGRDSSVSIATRYGLEGPGVESRWGRDFLHPFRPDLGPTQPPMQWVPGLFPRGKAAGAWRWPPPYLAPRLKKE